MYSISADEVRATQALLRERLAASRPINRHVTYRRRRRIRPLGSRLRPQASDLACAS